MNGEEMITIDEAQNLAVKSILKMERRMKEIRHEGQQDVIRYIKTNGMLTEEQIEQLSDKFGV